MGADQEDCGIMSALQWLFGRPLGLLADDRLGVEGRGTNKRILLGFASVTFLASRLHTKDQRAQISKQRTSNFQTGTVETCRDSGWFLSQYQQESNTGIS